MSQRYYPPVAFVSKHKGLIPEAFVLHRNLGKVHPRDVGVDEDVPLEKDTMLLFPFYDYKGLSCFSNHNFTLGGSCHVVNSDTLNGCNLVAVPTEVFESKTDPNDILVHFVVQPTSQMTRGEFENHWNYPSNQQAVQPRAGPGQLTWALCQIKGAAETVELKHRFFRDANLQMVSLALRSFFKSTSADDNDRLLAYLLHYSFDETDTAASYSKPNALSPPSRNLIYHSLENLLMDKDECHKYELDELDEQRLQWLMVMFQPIAIFSFLAEGHSTIDPKLIENFDVRAKIEGCFNEYISKIAFGPIPDIICHSEIALKASVDFLFNVAFPAFKPLELHIKVPFTFKVDGDKEVTIERICSPSFLLEEPDNQEMQHFCFKDAGIIHTTEDASEQHPALIIDDVQTKEEDLVISMSHLSLKPTLLRAQVKSLLAQDSMRQAVQCSAVAPSKKRQCKNRTLHPSGKCHVHMYS